MNQISEINNIGDILNIAFHHTLVQDIKKLDDKEGLALKEWAVEVSLFTFYFNLVQRFNVREKKQAIQSKTSESIRSNSHLVTTALISIQVSDVSK